MSIRVSARVRRLLPVAAATVLLSLSASGPGYGQNGFVGDVNDPVTGWRCVTPFCDTLLMPKTQCLCQKLNPTERTLSKLKLKCVPPRRDSPQACTLPRGFGG